MHFCSTTRNDNGNKQNIIKGVPVRLRMYYDKKQRIICPTQNTQLCNGCTKVKRKTLEINKGRSLCKDCSLTFTHYLVSPNEQHNLIRLIQFACFLCQHRFYSTLQDTLRIDEPILQDYLATPLDLSLCPIFKTQNCQVVSDIIEQKS